LSGSDNRVASASAIKSGVGGIFGQAAAHQQHARGDRAGRALPIGKDLGDRWIGGIDRLDHGEAIGVALLHRDRIARVIAVHRERRD
jgi:hypothetical protein